MIRVCKRCGCDIELPDNSRIRFCQKGTVCYTKRMSEKVKKCLQKKSLINNNNEVVSNEQKETQH